MDTIPLPKLTIFLFSISASIASHVGRNALSVWLAVTFVLMAFLIVPSAHAQLVTKNQFVEADVSSDGSGLFTIFHFDANGNKERLTFENFSYLTVQVGNEFFTNNGNGPTVVEPDSAIVNPSMLINGTTALVKGILPGTDTIRTIWQPK